MGYLKNGGSELGRPFGTREGGNTSTKKGRGTNDCSLQSMDWSDWSSVGAELGEVERLEDTG